jgi:integrase/recombinase XerC
MNQLALPSSPLALSGLVAVAGERASIRYMEFFAVTIGNPRQTGRWPGFGGFCTWRMDARVASSTQMQPLHVAGHLSRRARPMIK